MTESHIWLALFGLCAFTLGYLVAGLVATIRAQRALDDEWWQ